MNYLSFTVVIPKYIYNNKNNNDNKISLIRSDKDIIIVTRGANFNKISVHEARRRLYFRDFERKKFLTYSNNSMRFLRPGRRGRGSI
jgi:hypothetical protein